jgi:CheY-like chemotaxis protein
MLNRLDVTRSNPILEALPDPSRGYRTRGSTPGEPSEGRDNHSIESPRFPPSPSSGLPDVLRGVRVLVVDDDEDTVDLFAAALAACGAEVVTATSAPEALSLVALRSPAIVVSDIAMPGTDGYWLVREIRQLTDERLRTIPVIAVTAFGREHMRAESLAAGFVDHLEKPVDPEALCRAVARARVR